MRSESKDALSAVLSKEGRAIGPCWEKLKPKGPKGAKGAKGPPPRAICTVLLDPRDLLLRSERTQGFAAGPVYGRAKCLPMLAHSKPKGRKGLVYHGSPLLISDARIAFNLADVRTWGPAPTQPHCSTLSSTSD